MGSGFQNLSKALIHDLRHTIHLSCELIDIFGAGILVAAVVLACINLYLCGVNTIFGTRYSIFAIKQEKRSLIDGTASIEKIRKQLGDFTALGLEVLVVSDILETLMKSAYEYTFEELGKIALIATFRTVLAYFLSREVNEISEHLEKEKEFNHHKNIEREIILGPDVTIHGKTNIKEE